MSLLIIAVSLVFSQINMEFKKMIPCINDILKRNESIDLCSPDGEYKYSFTDLKRLYTYINKFSDDIIPVERNKKWGVIKRQKTENQYYKCIGKCPEIAIDEDYSIIIPFEYDYISECDNINCIAVKNKKWGVISSDNKSVINFNYEYLEFSEDLLLAKSNKEYGFIDFNNVIKIPFKYSYASSFNEGLAVVYSNNKCGYIDKNGKTIIPLMYDRCSSFYQNLAVVKLNNKYFYINKENKNVYQKNFEEANPFYENFATIKENGKWYLFDLSLKKIKELDADEIYPFSSGLARFKKNLKYGFIDINGDIKHKPIFDYADDFKFFLAKAEINKKNFILDTFGKLVLTDYDRISNFGKFIIVTKGERKGVLDENYNDVLQPIFDEVKIVSDRYFIIKENNKYKFATKEGRVLDGEYDSILPESFINPPQLAELCIDKKCALYNIEASKMLSDFEFDELNIFEDRVLFKKNSKVGYMTRTGKILMPAEYDGISQIEGTIVAIKKNNKMGIFDLKQQKETIPPIYNNVFIILDTIEAKTSDGKKLCFNTTDYTKKKCPY